MKATFLSRIIVILWCVHMKLFLVYLTFTKLVTVSPFWMLVNKISIQTNLTTRSTQSFFIIKVFGDVLANETIK